MTENQWLGLGRASCRVLTHPRSLGSIATLAANAGELHESLVSNQKAADGR
jgi:hypothetical protein